MLKSASIVPARVAHEEPSSWTALERLVNELVAMCHESQNQHEETHVARAARRGAQARRQGNGRVARHSTMTRQETKPPRDSSGAHRAPHLPVSRQHLPVTASQQQRRTRGRTLRDV